jgi:segregation and condensation protein A
VNPFAVQLPQYEGPLDLLLSIVRRHELPITDLPLAPIAAQYLAYIKEAEGLDVNLGMEWLDMAARLIHWKALSLLPADPAMPDAGSSFARELSQELKTLTEAQLLEAKTNLQDRSTESGHGWTHRSQEGSEELLLEDEEDPSASLWTVRKKAQALTGLFRKRREMWGEALELEIESTSVEEMKWIALRDLESVERDEWFSAAHWFAAANTLERQICLFLAMLDLSASGHIYMDTDVVESSVRLLRR